MSNQVYCYDDGLNHDIVSKLKKLNRFQTKQKQVFKKNVNEITDNQRKLSVLMVNERNQDDLC